MADREITDDTAIAESMNKYFSYVFTNETYENFPTIRRILNEELSDIQCTVEEVERHLKMLNVCKSFGPDNVPPRILKERAGWHHH